MNFIEIDGQEGGGQILRTSLSLSVILNKPIRIFNIRKNRPKPGLKNQHLMCINSLKEICNADVEGAYFGSQEIIFIPGNIISKNYSFDIQTAGAIGLVIQTILPLAFSITSELKINIKGGTHVPLAPTITYIQKVFLPVLEEIGIKAKINCLSYGFYPKGGGEVEIYIWPVKYIKSLRFEDKKEEIKTEILLCNLPDHIAKREIEVLKGYTKNIKIIKDSSSTGNCITVYTRYKGSTGLGKIGFPAEKIAKDTINEFKGFNSSLDKYLVDQILIYLALCNKRSELNISELSEHAKSNILVIEKFLGNIFEFNGNKLIRK
ncbi:RNA 3'-phosphate cyclase [Candidatus Micrarchaeota archaeon]|jgi:RNA 3'-terminal phosphate cyclase (ATP)|nr:RNA 3'-phosphate cyclase [Candidatus Micrarchaeota archaeon]